MFIDTTASEVVLICVTSIIGISAVSAALEGFFVKLMSWPERILCVAGGLLLIYPGLVTDVIGVAIVGSVVIFQILTKNSHKKVSA
jgi:TRAP-type uncharacterized transport system fused permease subunit